MQRSNFHTCLLLSVLFLVPSFSSAQLDSLNKRTSIAIFSPLYLDSAYDAGGNYRLGKNIPKFLNPGLEFYQGIQLAIDSLEKENVEMDVHVFDTRSSKKLDAIISGESIKDMDLFIGYVNVNEAAQLARAAAGMQIPFVNINLPNDAGVKNNPHYIVLNPTLSTHITAIYKYLQKNHALSPITYFRKKGASDDRLKTMFTEAEKATLSVPLKIRYVTLEDSVTTEQLKKFLDSTKNNICIAGSLDMNFGLMITRQLSAISKSYKTTIVGMPTWEQADFSKSAYRNVEVVYSSPLYVNNDNRLVQQLQHHFKTKYFSRTSDIVYTGFETLYYFGHLFQKPGDDFTQLFAKKKNTLFGEIDIQPVNNKQTGQPEYFENKKLYFIKKLDGNVKGVH